MDLIRRIRIWWVGCDRCPSRRFHRVVVELNHLGNARIGNIRISDLIEETFHPEEPDS